MPSFLQEAQEPPEAMVFSLSALQCILEMRNHNSKFTAQNMKFFTKDFFSKCDQIRSKLRIWSYLLKKSFVKNFIFCAVTSLLELS